ncbi:hypothetical protein [Georgenia sp. Z1491]|uniref:hypothetical protein n=1 Tax=Georgenia sp. Z1491 TaxID=3416707 RepID=UPI003CE88C83
MSRAIRSTDRRPTLHRLVALPFGAAVVLGLGACAGQDVPADGPPVAGEDDGAAPAPDAQDTPGTGSQAPAPDGDTDPGDGSGQTAPPAESDSTSPDDGSAAPDDGVSGAGPAVGITFTNGAGAEVGVTGSQTADQSLPALQPEQHFAAVTGGPDSPVTGIAPTADPFGTYEWQLPPEGESSDAALVQRTFDPEAGEVSEAEIATGSGGEYAQVDLPAGSGTEQYPSGPMHVGDDGVLTFALGPRSDIDGVRAEEGWSYVEHDPSTGETRTLVDSTELSVDDTYLPDTENVAAHDGQVAFLTYPMSEVGHLDLWIADPDVFVEPLNLGPAMEVDSSPSHTAWTTRNDDGNISIMAVGDRPDAEDPQELLEVDLPGGSVTDIAVSDHPVAPDTVQIVFSVTSAGEHLVYVYDEASDTLREVVTEDAADVDVESGAVVIGVGRPEEGPQATYLYDTFAGDIETLSSTTGSTVDIAGSTVVSTGPGTGDDPAGSTRMDVTDIVGALEPIQ